MRKEPKTIGELFFYIEGEFSSLRTEVDNMKRFVYWVAGLTAVAATTISVGILKVVRIL